MNLIRYIILSSMGTCNVTAYSFILIQLVCLIAGMMNLIGYVILYVWVHNVTVYFIFVQLICLIAGMMNLIRFVILLCMGTLCNFVFFSFDTACLLDSMSDGSH